MIKLFNEIIDKEELDIDLERLKEILKTHLYVYGQWEGECFKYDIDFKRICITEDNIARTTFKNDTAKLETDIIDEFINYFMEKLKNNDPWAKDILIAIIVEYSLKHDDWKYNRKGELYLKRGKNGK